MPTMFTNVRVVPSHDPASGGLPFEVHAPHPGFAVVGLLVRSGDWIDQVQPIFAELLEDGALGPELYGPAFGGNGGQTRELRLTPGYVATGIQTRSGNYLDGIRLQQTRWDGSLGGDTSYTQWITGANMGGVERPERIAEPRGRAVVVGLAGRAGCYVDNLTVITAEIHRVNTTAVAGRTNAGGRTVERSTTAMG